MCITPSMWWGQSSIDAWLRVCAALCVLSCAVSAYALDDYARGEQALAHGDFAQALDLFHASETQSRERALEAQLRVWRILGDNFQLDTVYAELRRLRPNDIALRFEHALVLWHLGQRERAEQLASVRATSAHALVARGRLLLWQGKLDAAQRSFAQAQIREASSDAALGLAYIATMNDDVVAAQQHLTAALAHDTVHVPSLLLQAWMYAWDGRFDDSIALFHRCLELSPNHPEAVRGLAQSYAWDGQFRSSAGYYETLLELQPGNPDVLLALGKVAQRSGDYDNAIDYLTYAQELAPHREDVSEELRLAQQWVANVESQIRDSRRSLALLRGQDQDYMKLGQAYNWQGQLKEALGVYEHALVDNPHSPQLLMAYGETLERLDRLGQAKSVYQEILDMHPQHNDARAGLARLRDAFMPAFGLNYTFDRDSDYDVRTDDEVIRSRGDMWSLTARQPLHAKYALNVSYSLGRLRQDDIFFDVTDYALTHHKVTLGHELTLPYDMSVYLAYDMHMFRNRGNNFFNLNRNDAQHGGVAVLEKYFSTHLLALQASRQYFQTVSNSDVVVASADRIAFSHDMSLGDNVSVFSDADLSRNSLDNTWRRGVSVRPRLRLPPFPNLSAEYEWAHRFNPVVSGRNGHMMVVRWLANVRSLSFELGYGVSKSAGSTVWSHLGEANFYMPLSSHLSANANVNVSGSDGNIAQSYTVGLQVQM